MKYIFTPTAEDDFDRLTRPNRKRIAEKMRFYASHDDPLQFAERLTDSHEYLPHWRLPRDFRNYAGIIWVNAIKRRDEAYRWFTSLPFYFRPSACGAWLT
jgi:mRNA-degrading endonuclease RelE of RelBE toxin-antitoxin system